MCCYVNEIYIPIMEPPRSNSFFSFLRLPDSYLMRRIMQFYMMHDPKICKSFNYPSLHRTRSATSQHGADNTDSKSLYFVLRFLATSSTMNGTAALLRTYVCKSPATAKWCMHFMSKPRLGTLICAVNQEGSAKGFANGSVIRLCEPHLNHSTLVSYFCS